MNNAPLSHPKPAPADAPSPDLETAMHDALVKVAGPLLSEQTDMRAQLQAHRLLLTLAFATQFANDRDTFDALMGRLVEMAQQATHTLPGGPQSPEAQSARDKVQTLLLHFQAQVGRTIAATAGLAS